MYIYIYRERESTRFAGADLRSQTGRMMSGGGLMASSFCMRLGARSLLLLVLYLCHCCV